MKAMNWERAFAALERMTTDGLRRKYAEVFGEQTNGRNKAWLVKRIAWRMQVHCFLLACTSAAAVIVAPAPAATPKFELGEDTTYLTGPLDAEGFVDSETALNERLRGKIEPGEKGE